MGELSMDEPGTVTSEEESPKIDLATVNVSLAPMLIDHEALRKEFQTRKVPFVSKGIHVADIQLEEGRGWTVTKKGVRKATVHKPKPISRMLEDRFWSLCRAMGYPIMNGSAFKIEFQRVDGSTSSKQIDVFAKDDETVIIAECKTKETRGRKSLQKDLHETAFLQKHLANSIRSHFGGGYSPKIVWLYVTQNIIWSEPDLGRANAANIRVITENELQYFEAYINHLGSAGRYQFLAEFLAGQEIPNLSDLKVAAVRGRLGNETFYSFTLPAGHLLKLAFVNHHALNNPEGGHRRIYQIWWVFPNEPSNKLHKLMQI
jgi:Holliday junction resolvase